MRWKGVERGIAKLLNTRRIPVTGQRGFDLETDCMVVEVKSRASIGKYLWDFMQQVLQGAKEQGKGDKIPAVVVHRPGMPYADALLCIRIRDYVKVHLLPPDDNDNTNIPNGQGDIHQG